MSHNGNIIHEVTNSLNTLRREADDGLERLKNSGTGGGVIPPSVESDLGGYVHRADLAVEAFVNEVHRLAVLMEMEGPIKELRISLDNKNLRAKLSPEAQAAWDELKDHINNPPPGNYP